MKKNMQLVDFYNKVYKKGEKLHYTKYLIEGTPTSETEEVLNQISWKNKKVLEVGCGTGLFASQAAKKGATVLGIDFSDKAINLAKKRYKIKNLELKHMNINDIQGKFDVIVSIGTLEHMDDPLKILKLFKSHLKPRGKIIITSPNWTNPRGYILITLWYLFKAPITLADLHYLTPVDFMNWAKKLNMKLKWITFDRSWGHGELMIKDFHRRIARVLADTKLPNKRNNIENLLDWLKKNVVPLDNSLPHSGALGMYVLQQNYQTKSHTPIKI